MTTGSFVALFKLAGGAAHYDWRAQEAALNAYPQFRADVGGTELHFVHVRGKGKKRVPLLLIHAFPDSFYRFQGDPAARRSRRARR